MRSSLPLAMMAVVALSATAQASPITTPPPVITALGGDVTAVYIFADATDASNLGLTTPPPINVIFCNHPTATCSSPSSAGDMMDLGNRTGLLTFTLDDTTTGNMFDSVHPDAFGIYHAKITTDYSAFGLGALPAAAMTALAGMSNVTFIGWEDHTMSDSAHDFDYNDLVFAFSNTAPNGNPTVPEPLTLSLLGAGLLGVFGLRKRRKV